MSTFAEIQAEYKACTDKKTVLLYLIEHLDTNFRSNAGADPKQKLLDDSKIPVPETAFEAVVAEILSAELEQLSARISQIEQSTIAPPVPTPAPAESTTQPTQSN